MLSASRPLEDTRGTPGQATIFSVPSRGAVPGLAPGSRVVRAVVVLSVVAGLVAYAGPRLVALNSLPGRVGRSVASADRYNAGLEQVTGIEGTTLANLEPLDRVRTSLAGVLATLAGLGGGLSSVTARVQGDLAKALDPSVPALAHLVASLGELESHVRALGAPLASSVRAIADARAVLSAVLAQTGRLADSVHQARLATDGAAANVAPGAR